VSILLLDPHRLIWWCSQMTLPCDMVRYPDLLVPHRGGCMHLTRRNPSIGSRPIIEHFSCACSQQDKIYILSHTRIGSIEWKPIDKTNPRWQANRYCSSELAVISHMPVDALELCAQLQYVCWRGSPTPLVLSRHNSWCWKYSASHKQDTSGTPSTCPCAHHK
jgi:hypothetical protein